jgi:cyanophycin synthetase
MKKIAITGTKGKTTVSSIISQVLQNVEPAVLRVDTSGAYLNNELKISKAMSQIIWDVVPTVAPGRFLYLLAERFINDPSAIEGQDHDRIPGVAVLEASLGCGTSSGLGYYGHNVGVFTNVFEDHLGSRADLNTRADIGRSKSFVFSRINRDGYAVFNADDDVVVSVLSQCKEGVHLLPFGLEFAHFDIQKHLKEGGYALTTDGKDVVLLHGSDQQTLFDYSSIGWTFRGKFKPSVYNLLAVTGALLSYGNMQFPDEIKQALLSSYLDHDSGRLTLLENKAGVTVLADYAHEKQSLKSVAELAHALKKAPENKVIGVLRLAWDRDDALISDTAHYIANSYDRFVVYDKIDGYWRQPSERYRTYQRQFHQAVGKISQQFSDVLVEARSRDEVTRILREDEALEEAARIAQPGDVVVFIVNDNITRSLGFVKDKFRADFV